MRPTTNLNSGTIRTGRTRFVPCAFAPLTVCVPENGES
jgi:hypothetical protein